MVTHAELTATVPYSRDITKNESANHASQCLKKASYEAKRKPRIQEAS